MAIVLYNGEPIFGIRASTRVARNPPDEQRTAYFGLNGFERKAGGTRGTVATVAYLVRQPGYESYAAALQLIDAYYNSQSSYPLVDDVGRIWPAMKFKSVVPGSGNMIAVSGYILGNFVATLEAPY